ncbi:MAG: hypothetical protein OXE05_04895 [Chloroflexi bacterium]|nr:hypothetical protein [Chloroflexota bacterium]
MAPASLRQLTVESIKVRLAASASQCEGDREVGSCVGTDREFTEGGREVAHLDQSKAIALYSDKQIIAHL